MSKVLRFENTAKVQVALAEKYLKKGDLPSAVQAYRLAYGMSGDESLCVSMGEAYLHAGLVDVAFDSYCEAYVKGNRSTQCFFGLCRAAFFLGYDKDSGDYFKKIFLGEANDVNQFDYEMDELGEEFSEVTGGVENKGFTFVKSSTEKAFDEEVLALVRNNPEKALPYFENVPKSSKLFYEARNNIALIKLMLGSFQEAYDECCKILRAKPNDVFALSTMLATLASMGEKEKAREIAKKIDRLAIVDEEDLRKVSLAMCQAEIHDYAVKYLEKLRCQQYDKNVMVLKAIAYHNVGKNDRALDLIKNLRKLYPKDEPFITDTELKMRYDDSTLPYSVIMLHGETLLHIGESRRLFGAEEDEKIFDFDTFVEKIKDERNYRLLYWYLTNHAYFCKNDEILILFRLAQTGDERCMDFLTEILRDINVENDLKCKSIRILVCNGYDKAIHLVQGARIKSSKPIYPVDYVKATEQGKNALLWADAFSIVYSELFMRGENFEEELCAIAEKVRDNIMQVEKNRLRSPFALAAVMFQKTKLGKSFQEKEIREIFGVTNETFKKYEKLCDGDNI